MARAKAAGSDVRDRAKALASLALDTLAEIMRGGGTDTVRLAAAREVLDRAHGKQKAGESDGGEAEGVTVVLRRFEELPDYLEPLVRHKAARSGE
jgi:hypothetical protein